MPIPRERAIPAAPNEYLLLRNTPEGAFFVKATYPLSEQPIPVSLGTRMVSDHGQASVIKAESGRIHLRMNQVNVALHDLPHGTSFRVRSVDPKHADYGPMAAISKPT